MRCEFGSHNNRYSDWDTLNSVDESQNFLAIDNFFKCDACVTNARNRNFSRRNRIYIKNGILYLQRISLFWKHNFSKCSTCTTAIKIYFYIAYYTWFKFNWSLSSGYLITFEFYQFNIKNDMRVQVLKGLNSTNG